MTLPWANNVGLLCSYYVLNFGGAPSWAIVLSWVAVTTSGHTKVLQRVTLPTHQFLTTETEAYCQRHSLRRLLPRLYSMHSVLESGLQAKKLCPLGYLPGELCLSLVCPPAHLRFLKASYFGDFALLFAIRYVLNRENKRRDALQTFQAHEEYGYLEKVASEGQVVRQKINKGMLDMTDRQNLAFRYAL